MTQQEMKRAAVAALESNDLEAIRTLALADRKILSVLVRLAYDKETLVGRRAIVAIGRVASVFAANNYDFLRETVRKLLWSLSDESGAIGWSAPEILGEIVSADPKNFADVVPLIAEVYSIEERVFRPGVLYAFRKIAETHPDMIMPYLDIIVDGLSEKDPEARIYALELAGMLKERFDFEKLKCVRSGVGILVNDKNEAWIYSNDNYIGIEVGNTADKVSRQL
jgi:hypothetical protein